MAKKPKLMRAYRLQEQIIAEIERLADEWECTHAEVVERAIAHMREGGFDIASQPLPREPANVVSRSAKPPLLKPSERGKKG